jgi:predicted ATPase/DNA-binding SARP family transcriptional activator
LGSPKVKLREEVIHFTRRKTLALLAYLAVTGKSYTRDYLATLLWPELDYRKAMTALRSVLSDLRRVAGLEHFSIEQENIGLKTASDVRSDVAAFMHKMHVWREHCHPVQLCLECIGTVTQAIELYKGDFMEGFSLPDCPQFDYWQYFTRQEIQKEMASSLEYLTAAHAALEEYERAIFYANRRLVIDTTDEPAHRTLMYLYSKVGQRSNALRQYEICKRNLKDELSLEPQQETYRLYKSILENQPISDASTISMDVGQIKQRHNLPNQSIPFIGREELLACIQRKLQDPTCRLLSLVGLGGSGKTRLAIETGKQQLANYKHGVYYISLESLTSTESIIPSIARALDFPFREGSKPRQQLFNYLKGKSLLLILDNYEHLLEGTVVASEILHAAQQVKILATSRTRLNLFDEQMIFIPGMRQPARLQTTDNVHAAEEAMKCDSIKLFVQAAARIQSFFELSDRNIQHVVTICRLVQGMPLGILLAASWLRLLSLQEIASEIEKSIDFLRGELRDLPDRQQSLRAVFDYSWQMLDENQQKKFMALSVFRNGCVRQAAEQIAGVSLHDLVYFVDRSFLQREENGRYTMHSLVHQYAVGRLAEIPELLKKTLDHHSTYFIKRLQEWECELRGPNQRAVMDTMDAEIENCRAAWQWAVENQKIDDLGIMLEGYFLYHRFRFQDFGTAFDSAVKILSDIPSPKALRLLSGLLARQATLLFYLGPLAPVVSLFKQAETALEHPVLAGHNTRREFAEMRRLKGPCLAESIHHVEARIGMEQSLSFYREKEEKWAIAEILAGLSKTSWMAGEIKQSMNYSEESLALYRALENPNGIARALTQLGDVATWIGQIKEGENYLREAIEIQRQTFEPYGLGIALLLMGFFVFVLGKGEFDEGKVLIEEYIQICREYGIYPDLVLSLNSLSFTRLCQGEYQDADEINQSALEMARQIDYQRGIALCLYVKGWVKMAKSNAEEAFQCCCECVRLSRGEYMPPEELCDALTGLGAVLCLIGKPIKAAPHIYQVLKSSISMGILPRLKLILPVIALLKSAQGNLEEAISLYEMGKTHFPFLSKAIFLEDIIGRRIEANSANLPPAVVAAAKDRGRKLDIEETTIRLLDELKINSCSINNL